MNNLINNNMKQINNNQITITSQVITNKIEIPKQSYFDGNFKLASEIKITPVLLK
jgi:hypothetical protein